MVLLGEFLPQLDALTQRENRGQGRDAQIDVPFSADVIVDDGNVVSLFGQIERGCPSAVAISSEHSNLHESSSGRLQNSEAVVWIASVQFRDLREHEMYCRGWSPDKIYDLYGTAQAVPFQTQVSLPLYRVWRGISALVSSLVPRSPMQHPGYTQLSDSGRTAHVSKTVRPSTAQSRLGGIRLNVVLPRFRKARNLGTCESPTCAGNSVEFGSGWLVNTNLPPLSLTTFSLSRPTAFSKRGIACGWSPGNSAAAGPRAPSIARR